MADRLFVGVRHLPGSRFLGRLLDLHDQEITASGLGLHVHLGEVGFADGAQFHIPFELMRVYSPSAEVKGHGPGQEVLQTGKREIDVVALEPVGNYAVQPTFSDGHSTGIFSWDYLYFLGSQQQTLWQQYEERLQQAGASRDEAMAGAVSAGCGHSH